MYITLVWWLGSGPSQQPCEVGFPVTHTREKRRLEWQGTSYSARPYQVTLGVNLKETDSRQKADIPLLSKGTVQKHTTIQQGLVNRVRREKYKE